MSKKEKLRPVVCVECKTEYWILATKKRNKSYENCANEDCNCRKFRAVKSGTGTKKGDKSA